MCENKRVGALVWGNVGSLSLFSPAPLDDARWQFPWTPFSRCALGTHQTTGFFLLYQNTQTINASVRRCTLTLPQSCMLTEIVFAGVREVNELWPFCTCGIRAALHPPRSGRFTAALACVIIQLLSTCSDHHSIPLKAPTKVYFHVAAYYSFCPELIIILNGVFLNIETLC